MSSGRMHESGTIHLVTNRCEQGQFLMLPKKEIVEIIQYWFARAMEKYGSGLEIFAFIILSNHFHLLLRDTGGQLAQFMCYFQGNVAKEINLALGRKGAHFWQGHYDDQIIEGERTLWNKYFYVLANAVKSSLVYRAVEWKGWSSLSMLLSGKSFSISRLNRTKYHNASRGKTKPSKKDFIETFSFDLAPLPMIEDLTPKEQRRNIRQVTIQRLRPLNTDSTH